MDGLEEAGGARADTLVALTRNSELNLLVAQRARENFRIERLIAWSGDRSAERPASAPLQPFPGRFPGVDEANAALRGSRLAVVEYEVRDGAAVGKRVVQLPWADGEFALLVRRGEAVVVVTDDHELAKGDRLRCAKPKGTTSPLAELLDPLRETTE